MTFTIRDVIYIIIIIAIISGFYLFIKKDKAAIKEQNINIELQRKIEQINIKNTNDKLNYQIDSINKVINALSLKKEDLLKQNIKLKKEINFIQSAYDKTVIHFDTFSVNQALRYWSDELEYRQY